MTDRSVLTALALVVAEQARWTLRPTMNHGAGRH
jgi:hypothetical protein